MDVCSDYVDGYPMVTFCFVFALVHHVVPLCFQLPLAQLIPVSWTGSIGPCSVHLSLMSMDIHQLTEIATVFCHTQSHFEWTSKYVQPISDQTQYINSILWGHDKQAFVNLFSHAFLEH
jgi:hypothetical protein